MAAPELQAVQAGGLLLTDWCPARCRHCYVSAGPHGRRWMSAEDAEAHFAALARLGVPAAGVHVGGGEPFGDFDRLLDVVRAARRAGLDGVGYVETSGAWATSAEEVRRRLRALAEAGMRQLSISADPYHQEFIPPERVRTLYETAREVLGDGGVRARRWRWLKDPRDVARLAEPERLALFRAHLRAYPERMSGRAAERLAPLLERVPLEEIPEQPCGEPLLARRHVHVDPGGWVFPGTCTGLVLGRAGPAAPLDALLGDWRLDRSPVIAQLAAGGPRRLAAWAARFAFAPDRRGYAGTCHLCWAVRAFLVRAGAGGDELKPESLYRLREHEPQEAEP